MPQRDHLAVNFLQSVIIADLWRREVEYVKNFREIFLVCLEKRPLTVKFSQFCSDCFYRLTRRVVFKFRKIWPTGKRKWAKLCVIYQTKKNQISPASQTVATARMAPKICQGQPPNNVLRVRQISSKSVHFRRSYSRTREHREIAP